MNHMNKRFAALLCSAALLYTGCSSAASTDTSNSDNSEASSTETNLEGLSIQVESNILGMADTGNKTSLKETLIKTSGPGDINLYYYNEDGQRVKYNAKDASDTDPDQSDVKVELEPVQYTGSAILSIDGVEDASIDVSKATVHLLDGNGYRADDFVLSEQASKLNGSFKDGKLEYTLQEGDLLWNYYDYQMPEGTDSGREWSIMGGDGNGVYSLRLEVEGIEVDGQPVKPVVIPATVYIYGRSVSDLAIHTEFVENEINTSFETGTTPSGDIQWIWTSENESAKAADEPYMNDLYTDYFTIVWPEGTDAEKVAAITAEDVTLTLSSAYVDEYEMTPVNVYGEREYDVITNADKTETTIAVSYQQWSSCPVYSELNIAVDGDLQAENQYDVSSVTAYYVQTGGGGVEVNGTTVAYDFHGVENLTYENAINPEYTLMVELHDEAGYEDGTYFYAEEDGKGVLIPGIEGDHGYSAPEEAWKGTVTEDSNVVASHVVFNQTVKDEAKEVDGKTYEFSRVYTNYLNAIPDMLEKGATLVKGFNVDGCAVLYNCWSWSMRYESGWLVRDEKPEGAPYVYSIYGYGYPDAEHPSENYLIEEQEIPVLEMK